MQRDHDDIMWGAILALLGLGVAAYAAACYDMGSLRRMGPGFFPVMLGIVLAVLGAAIAVPAWWRKGVARPLYWREALGVTASLMLFSVLMGTAGIVVATVVTTLVASSVAPRGGTLWRVVLAVVVAALTWLIFIAGLSMSIPVWPWS
ncbi:tripartite tricarboxylate transporter TctB family protein [Falsirhodobacter deserti]|uniref:tripartite tricarboxylate transporter TctB family protein n=1 Tax=Falsirhodobacter deserti TaxID=1365611 RepID=UPI000FE43944|nr:tripartite tricarboxylate transporter TctB family protein [Falsirhodobacter deserti]